MIPVPLPADNERFRKAVQRWFGLAFDEGRLTFLLEVLHRRIDASGGSPEAYLSALEAPDCSRDELRVLARELTVTETSFFRNLDQMHAFTQVALPDSMAARSADRTIRILSAGCASGEEAYSLAACVRDHPDLGCWEVAIRGIDINGAMLQRAADGRYSAWSLRQTPASLRTRLFTPAGDAFVLDPAIRAMVRFEERNLIAEDQAFWAPAAFDVIFFRNVLMYFAPEVARAVIARMAQSLAPGGYLFLGHAEVLRGLSTDFHLRHTHGCFYYQRKGVVQAPGGVKPHANRQSLPNASLDAARTTDQSWIETIRQASQRIRLLTGTQNGARSPRQLDAPARLPTSTASSADLESAVDLLGRERFAEVEALLAALPPDRARDPDVLLLRAVLHTHGGNLSAAERICAELLLLDDMNAGAHYLLALCRESAGDDRGAMRHDRIAAYLDPSFAMPRLHLGRLARRAGDRDGARRDLQQALLLIEREDSVHLLLFAGGFGRSALAALCRAELAVCGDVA